MPAYDYTCTACAKTHEQVHRMSAFPEPCPHCGSRKLDKCIGVGSYAHSPKDMGWENENNGRGRFIPQLGKIGQMFDEKGTYKNDPTAYCRSRSELFEKAKAKGLGIVEK